LGGLRSFRQIQIAVKQIGESVIARRSPSHGTALITSIIKGFEDLQHRESLLTEREARLVEREQRAARVDEALTDLRSSL
jgi:hypothetical protein